VSRDARNSLIAWGVVLALFGSFWLQAHYNVFPDLPAPPTWYDRANLALLAILIVWEIVRSIHAGRREKTPE
jgi:hypothetical protein